MSIVPSAAAQRLAARSPALRRCRRCTSPRAGVASDLVCCVHRLRIAGSNRLAQSLQQPQKAVGWGALGHHPRLLQELLNGRPQPRLGEGVLQAAAVAAAAAVGVWLARSGQGRK